MRKYFKLLASAFVVTLTIFCSVLCYKSSVTKNYSAGGLNALIGRESGGWVASDGSYVISNKLVTVALRGLRKDCGLGDGTPNCLAIYAQWKANHGGYTAAQIFGTQALIDEINAENIRCGRSERVYGNSVSSPISGLGGVKPNNTNPGATSVSTTNAAPTSTTNTQLAQYQANIASLATQYQQAIARGDTEYANKCVQLTQVLQAQMQALK